MEKMDKLEATGLKAQIDELLENESFFLPAAEGIFEAHDTDKSGFIEINEFYDCLKQLNDEAFHIPDFNEKKAEEYLGKLDTNKDGKLSKEEYKPFLKKLLAGISEKLQTIIDA